VRGDTDHCLHEALAHMNLLGDLGRRGLDWSFHSPGRPLRGDDESQFAPDHGGVHSDSLESDGSRRGRPPPTPRLRREPPTGPLDIAAEDLPF
jgi:hypothetical protein